MGDLSECELTQVPDAICYMMRDTPLTACNLSSNVIMKIPPKFPDKFNCITELNVSHNSFIALPNCLLNLPKIVKLNAKKNFIADVDVELISTCDTLENLNLEDNPLARDCQERLSSVTSLRVSVTARDMEEWEDLSI